MCFLHGLPVPVAVWEETISAATSQKKQRGKYLHVSPKEKVTIGGFVTEHVAAKAVKHFKKSIQKKMLREIYITKKC